MLKSIPKSLKKLKNYVIFGFEQMKNAARRRHFINSNGKFIQYSRRFLLNFKLQKK